MECINLQQIRTIEDRMVKELSDMKSVLEQLEYLERQSKEMSYLGKMRVELCKSKEKITDNMKVLLQMLKILQMASEVYQNTDRKIEDRYNLDVVVVPTTRFAWNYIKGLDAYNDLIVF